MSNWNGLLLSVKEIRPSVYFTASKFHIDAEEKSNVCKGERNQKVSMSGDLTISSVQGVFNRFALCNPEIIRLPIHFRGFILSFFSYLSLCTLSGAIVERAGLPYLTKINPTYPIVWRIPPSWYQDHPSWYVMTYHEHLFYLKFTVPQSESAAICHLQNYEKKITNNALYSREIFSLGIVHF